MAEEQNQEVMPVETVNKTEIDSLKKEIESLKKKNYELIGKMQKKELLEIPPDYEALQKFKQNAEQEKLEREGKYGEAKTALEQQYREKSSQDKKRIEELESRNRELELIAPAMQALSEVTHDPELVLNNLVPKDQIQIREGIPVVVDGYEQLPVQEYVKNKLEKTKPYLLKNKLPTGGGAPISRPSTDSFSEDMLKPYLKETFNLSEQGRILKLKGREIHEKLIEIANAR